jgi:hypothetical protein
VPITAREQRLVAQFAGIKSSILPLNDGCVVREIVVDCKTSAVQTTDTLTGRGTLRAANSCLIARLATIAALRRNTVLPLDHCLYALQMTILAAPRPQPLAGKRWRQTETKHL